MKLKFRKLRAEEIEVRKHVYQDGVRLVLYKDARCDQSILDEAVGPTGWQRHHSRNNANCIVAIYDTDMCQWIEKEDTGTRSSDESEKGLASDSFKRACVNWGIGRELYTSPEMFISKDNLHAFYMTNDANPHPVCEDTFRVSELVYNDDNTAIESVEIEASYRGVPYSRTIFTKQQGKTFHQDPNKQPVYFQNKGNSGNVSGNAGNVNTENQNRATMASNTGAVNTQQSAPTPPATSAPKKEDISDDEIILIGNCRGKRYGDVKNTPVFLSFLKWIKTSHSTYKEEAQKEQFERLKKLAATV